MVEGAFSDSTGAAWEGIEVRLPSVTCCSVDGVFDVGPKTDKEKPAQFGGIGCTEQARRGMAFKGGAVASPTEAERMGIDATGI